MAKRRIISKGLNRLAASISRVLTDRLTSGQVRSTSSQIINGGRQAKSGLFLREIASLYALNYTVRTCIDAIAADVAHDHLWERVEGVEATPDQDAIKAQADALLKSPNPYMTEYDLLTAMTKDLLLTADSFTEVVYDQLIDTKTQQPIGKTPGQLWPIESPSMFIQPENSTGILPKPPIVAYEQLSSNGSTIPFAADEIIHVTEGNIAGRLYGTPRLLSALVLIATQFHALRYNLKTFSGQKYPKSLVGVGQLQNDSDLDRLITKAEEQAQENPNGLMFLEAPALQLLKLIDSNRDMEFIELVKFAERSVCAVFRVPPVRIGISEAGGAGIVVGSTQMAAYWNGVEEIQRQHAESLNLFFTNYMGLRAYRLRFQSGRPELYSDEATVEDVRIKNGSLTVNEARKRHGLPPVAWGDMPPVVGAPPMMASMPPAQQPAELSWQPPEQRPWSFWQARKDVAANRMEDSPLVDTEAERVQEKTRSRLAGTWMRAREAMLKVFDEADIITKQLDVKKARVMSLAELSSRLDLILADWEKEADAVMADGNATAYADGKTGQTKDLEVAPSFVEADVERARAIHEQFALQPLKTYHDEQAKGIEDAVAQAQTTGEVSTYKIREAVEQNFARFSDEQTWKLDRIVRTSIGSANRTARAQALTDSGLDECKVITAGDARVRPSHAALHQQVVPISMALDVLNEPNCRCRIVKPSKHPATIPSPEDLAASIRAEEGQSGRRFMLEAIGGA